MKLIKRKQLSPSKQLGSIEVKVRQGDFKVIYENKIGLGDIKAIEKMVRELEHKGVVFHRKGKIEDGWW